MKKILAAVMMLSLALPAFADHSATHKRFKVMHVADLAAALKSATPPALFDANNKSVRAKYGVIPGAVLLTGYKKWSPKVLPADKDAALVFYCANTQCTASHYAADRALKLGYKNVSVMVDGIMGWKDAGEPTAKP